MHIKSKEWRLEQDTSGGETPEVLRLLAGCQSSILLILKVLAVFRGSMLVHTLGTSISDVCIAGTAVLIVVHCSYGQYSQYFGRQYCLVIPSALAVQTTTSRYSDYNRSFNYTDEHLGKLHRCSQ